MSSSVKWRPHERPINKSIDSQISINKSINKQTDRPFDDVATSPPPRPRSAGCSPLTSRKKIKLLGCAGTSCDSDYALNNISEVVDEQFALSQMSPASRRSRLRKIFASLTPTKKSKLSMLPEQREEVDLANGVEPRSPQFNTASFESQNSTLQQNFNSFKKPVASSDSLDKNGLSYVTLLVKVRLKDGQQLAVRDASGSSDPYVKFKYRGRVVYKSNTIFKDVNPVWEEEFAMLADDMTAPIDMEVYDYDRFCADDFMGGASLDISQLKWFTPVDMTVELKDENTVEELGSISLSLCVVPQTNDEKQLFLQKATRGVLSESQKKKEKLVQVWTSVVNVVLVEGKNLSINYNKTNPPDPYCKFKLGLEKYKSKVCSRTAEPKWLEQFDMHIFEGGSKSLEVMVNDKKTTTCVGNFPRDQTIQKWYELDDCSGSVLLLITVSGSQSKDSVVDLTEFDHNDVRNAVIERFDYRNTLKAFGEIGQLTVKVFRAEDLIAKDLGGKSDPFAVLELVNTRLQTHTEYKTLNPQWNKLFTFTVKDIHTCLEVTVYDEDPNNKFEFLGKVSIPLISIRNCERRWYALKNKKMTARVKGEILLELDVVWNPIRAAIRTFNPREAKYIEQDRKFKASLFRATVLELKEFALSVVEYKNFVQSCFDWHSVPRSITAFIIFSTTVYYIEIHHVPIFLLALFAKGYIYRITRPADGRQTRTITNGINGGKSLERIASREDDDAEDEKQSTSLRETLASVQETLGVVQNLLIFLNQLLQRFRNTVNFTNPWLSCLATIVLTVATILLYFVPVRWILLVWGINKFTKKLRNPHYIDNNELLDFLSRVPCDEEMAQWSQPRVEKISEVKDNKKVK